MTLSFQVAPSVAVSLPRSFRYPSLLREHCPGFCAPDVFPNDGSVLDRPLPYSQALPGGIRLFSISTTRQLRLPLRVLPSPLRVEGQYRGADSSFFAPTRPGVQGGRARVSLPTHPLSVAAPTDAYGSHRFPENPNVPLPFSWTPAGPRRLAFA